MSIDTIIFDLDDVLFDYDIDKRLSHLAGLSGRDAEDIYRDIWQSGFEDDADAGKWPDSAAYLAEFARRLGFPLTRDQWIEARRASMTPFADMLLLAEALSQQHQVAVLTNNDPLLREALDEVAPQVGALFGERVFFSCDFRLAKPDRELFIAVANACGRAPQQCLFTDDKAENAAGARQAGMTGVHFSGPARFRAALSTLGIVQ